MQTFNIIKLKKIIYIIFFLLVNSFAFSQDQNSVRNIYIELNLKENQDHRATAIESSYNIALTRYLTWITLSSSAEIFSLVNSLNSKDYISGYSIENEKYKKDKYSALITVNFEQKKLEKLLKEKTIKFFSKKGPETLIIPLIEYDTRLVLWDDPNPWFDTWLNRPLDSNLNLFILPSGEADDLITLSATDAKSLKYFKIKKLAKKYNASNAYVLLVNVISENNSYYYNLKAYNGFSQEMIYNIQAQPSKKDNLRNNLNQLANNFANYLDDMWVKKNLDNINSETAVIVEVEYKKYKEWIGMKNYLNNNEDISSYSILKISNKKALLNLNILSLDALVEDLIDNNYKINEVDRILSIKTKERN
ncbi:MAG: hypothetical protein CMP36_00495 [Rickettsiales bacterium]|nr:hypothetical protein [Rickettsiales bacterium]OUV83289.1 MAG: hypothetical protein CBC91_00875 [Rickettsiales bacterium TMED131]